LKAAFHVERAEGLYLYNKQGDKVLDGIASWWCCHHGHGHPKLLEALEKQAGKMVHVSLAGLSHDLCEELATRLRALSGLDYVFYSDNGSTAIEVALKICWQRAKLRGEEKRRLIVSFENGYHGDTLACMSVGKTDFHDIYSDQFFDVIHLPSPSRPSDCIEALEQLFEAQGDTVAGLIIEPLLQAAGGMLVHEEQTLKRIHELCRSHGVPMIADEIAVGLGRCGDLWATKRAGFVPDILCTSKGLTGGMLPLAATCLSAEIAEEFKSSSSQAFLNHGHTFTANPLACAVALASLDLIEAPEFLPHCRELENLLKENLPRFEAEIPGASVRHMGTVGIVQMDLPDSSEILWGHFKKMIDKGYFLRPLGNISYFWPPLTITCEEYQEMLDVSRETLKIVNESHV
jgi:adenosylmethionine-8-amino-7-oxononanoate aminotransferase